jgi:hypothetical protein
MRIVSVLLLMTSACALAACAGGGAGGGLSAAGTLANSYGVCSIDQDCYIPPNNPPATPSTDQDGDGIPDGKDGDGDGTTGSGAGGNTPLSAPGNKTVALQLFALNKADPGQTAVARLSSTSYANMLAVEDAIVSANKPKSLKFSIDTKNAKNSQWAVPLEMKENVYGSRDLRWIPLGHTTTAWASYNINDRNGNPILYNPAKNSFFYTVSASTVEPIVAGEEVDYQNDDFYWNKIAGYMGTKANAGSNGKYREYSVFDKEANRDEVLQVWSWDDSYAVQYQNRIIKGDAKQQAWTFGGKEATNLSTTGKSKFTGRFAATAKIEGWKASKESDINPNTVWKVQGRSEVTADFDTSKVDGILTPETWNSFQTKPDAYYTWFTSEAQNQNLDNTSANNTNHTKSTATPATPDFRFYSTKIILKGTIAGDPATPTIKNVYDGSAELQGFTTGDNTMQGGFFGTNGHETTGIFSTTGTRTEEIGGSDGQVDTFTGTESINGMFNGQCVSAPTAPKVNACAP